MSSESGAPFLGVGVGLRPKHYPRILETLDPARLGVDFFEAARAREILARVAREEVWDGAGGTPIARRGAALASTADHHRLLARLI